MDESVDIWDLVTRMGSGRGQPLRLLHHGTCDAHGEVGVAGRMFGFRGSAVEKSTGREGGGASLFPTTSNTSTVARGGGGASLFPTTSTVASCSERATWQPAFHYQQFAASWLNPKPWHSCKLAKTFKLNPGTKCAVQTLNSLVSAWCGLGLGVQGLSSEGPSFKRLALGFNVKECGSRFPSSICVVQLRLGCCIPRPAPLSFVQRVGPSGLHPQALCSVLGPAVKDR
eukprot:366421-Chlamydomonas_euryale.AAC.9